MKVCFFHHLSTLFPIKLSSFFLRPLTLFHLFEGLPSEVCEVAAGDEGCFYLGVYLQVGDVVYCSAGFGELSADIVFLWCVGLLVFVWHGGSACVAMFVCGRELQLCWGDSECHAEHHLSLCRGFGEHFLECLVVVTIENRPRCYASRHLMRKNPVAFSLIDPETNQLTLW